MQGLKGEAPSFIRLGKKKKKKGYFWTYEPV